MEIQKLMPQDLEIEEIVLGTLISSTDAMKKFANIIKPEIFYKLNHQTIAKALVELHLKSEPIDLMTIVNKLRLMGELNNVGGPVEISQLLSRVTNAYHLEAHIRILWQMHLFREIITICQEAEIVAYKQNMDVFDLLQITLEKFEKLDIQKKETVIKKISDYLDTITQDEVIDGKLIYRSGLPKFDKMMNFQPRDIVMVGSRNGAGKTKFVTRWMKGIMETNKDASILWCNMEDDTPKMLRGLTSCFVNLSYDQMIQNEYTLSEEDLAKIEAAKNIIRTWDIEFIDTGKHSLEIKSMFKYFCEQRPGRFCILIIDNIMKLRDNTEAKKGMNQTEKEDAIAASMGTTIEICNKKTKASIIMVHHYGSEIFNKLNLKHGYRAEENDLRGSMRLRDVCTKIVLINKPEQFKDLMSEYLHIEDAMNDLFITDLIKNRNSKKGVVRWFARPEINKFKEI